MFFMDYYTSIELPFLLVIYNVTFIKLLWVLDNHFDLQQILRSDDSPGTSSLLLSLEKSERISLREKPPKASNIGKYYNNNNVTIKIMMNGDNNNDGNDNDYLDYDKNHNNNND